MLGFVLARRLGLAAASGSVLTVGLCYPERHRTFDVHSAPHSSLERFLDPPIHVRLGVVFAVGVVDLILNMFFVAPGRSVTVTTHAGDSSIRVVLDAARQISAESIAARTGKETDHESALMPSQTVEIATTSGDVLRTQPAESKSSKGPLLVVLNHNTLLDAPLVAPMLGRATASKSASPWIFPWTTDPEAWPFCIGSASFLFNDAIKATFVSLICGMPIQPKWSAATDETFDLNRTNYIPNVLECLRRGRTMLICPEGRLVQAAIEPRDAEGRWMNKAGRKTEPGALVNAFHSGVGRMVAHSGSAVLPIAHCGLDSILAARGSSYAMANSDFNLLSPPVAVAVHVGAPLDFGPMLTAFELAHPHLVPFKAPNSWAAPDAMGPEKRQLYRDITEAIRKAVIECHSKALQERAEQSKKL